MCARQVSEAWAPVGTRFGAGWLASGGSLALMSPLFSPLLNFRNPVVEIQVPGQAPSEPVMF